MPSICCKNLQRFLRNAFKRQNLDDFKFALVNRHANPNFIPEGSKNSIFEDILLTPNSGPYITLCIENGAELYEKNVHEKYPLHYAVEKLSPQNLRAFLANYDPNKINVKLFDKNSLRLAMEMMNNLSEYENAVECIKMLIDKGCNINMPNSMLETPFYILLKLQDQLESRNKIMDDLIEYITKKCQVDLYTYREDETVELFERNNPHLQLPIKIAKDLTLNYMEMLIRNSREEDFMADYQKFKEENISNNFKEILDQLLYRGVEYESESIVQFLIDEGADVNANELATFSVKYPALELACIKGYSKILEILCTALKDHKLKGTLAKKKNILHLITEHFCMDSEKYSTVDYEKCFKVALEICDDYVINQQDEIGATALHYAARYKNEEAVLALLKKGAYIGLKDHHNYTPIDYITYDTFNTYLDECISFKPRKYEVNNDQQVISVDYNFLKPAMKSDDYIYEMLPLDIMTHNHELRPLVAHPVLDSYLFLKWSKLSFWFHLNLALTSFFMTSLIYFIVFGQTLTLEEQMNSKHFAFSKLLSFFSVTMIFIREFFQCVLSPLEYFKSVINYFEIALVTLGFILISYKDEDPDDGQLRILRAVTILFAAYEVFQLIGTLPYMSISTHMVILKKVAMTFLKSLLLYSILIVSFALCFFTLFGSGNKEMHRNKSKSSNEDNAFNSFGYPGIAITKTMVMLTGEFDAADLNLEEYNICYSIIFLLFLFIMTIVLFNLLNALAFDDTQNIRTEGELIDKCERIRILSNLEKIILNKSGCWMWLKKKISLFPHEIPQGKILIYIDKNNEIVTNAKTQNEEPTTEINFASGDVIELEILNSHRSQNINSHILTSLKKIFPFAKLVEIAKKMDEKIIKEIQTIFDDEQKNKTDDKVDELRMKLNSMECETKLLKSNIQELTDMFRKNFEANKKP